MIELISDFLKRVSKEIDEIEDTDTNKSFLKIESIRIAFSAPNPKDPSTKDTLTTEEKSFDPNFQWVKFQALFTVKPEMEKYYIYSTPLDTDGTSKEPDIVFDSDSKWGGNSKLPSNDYTPGDVIRTFPELLKGPELINAKKYGQTTYINMHKSDKAHIYSSQDFKRFFNNDFYIILSRSKKLKNPFGRTIGIEP